MALANRGFETVGDSPGLASGWTFTDADSVNEWAPFNTPSVSAEGFESEWDNDDYLFEFDDPNTQLTFAAYTTVHVATKFVENFEEKWDSNEHYAFGIGSSTPAVYDDGAGGIAFENFEQEWDLNEDYVFELGIAVEQGTFDGTYADFFDQNWDSNQDYLFEFVGVGTDLTAAVYDGVTDMDDTDFENFEQMWPTMVMTTV